MQARYQMPFLAGGLDQETIHDGRVPALFRHCRRVSRPVPPRQSRISTASSRSRYRAGQVGRMKPDWAPAAPALSCQIVPAVGAVLLPTSAKPMRRDGVEPPQPAGGWVTTTGARHCPADAWCSVSTTIRLASSTGGSRTPIHGRLKSVALPHLAYRAINLYLRSRRTGRPTIRGVSNSPEWNRTIVSWL